MQLVVPLGQLHDPLTHEAPPLQATPQAPQFIELAVRSTQPPLQSVRPGPHPEPHMPPLQTSVPEQALPQAPQLDRSELVLTHAPLHSVVPTGQVQAPLTQEAPVGQTLPHVPQFFESLCTDTQAPPQFV